MTNGLLLFATGFSCGVQFTLGIAYAVRGDKGTAFRQFSFAFVFAMVAALILLRG